MRENGFTLVPCLLGLTIAGAMLALLIVQLHTVVRQTGAAAGQLRALLLAHNGVEHGRAMLAKQGTQALLAGPDGLVEDPAPPRDPLPIDTAAQLSWPELGNYRPPVDDGWAPEGPPVGPPGGGLFLWRISNDPEESGPVDGDGIVLLRSMGIVPTRGEPGRSRHLAVVEARLRRAEVLRPEHAVVAVGSLEIELAADTSIEGGLSEAVSLLPCDEPTELRIMPPEAAEQLTGPEGPFSFIVQPDAGPPQRVRLTEPAFWADFRNGLPRFALPAVDGGSEAGLYVAEGDLSGHWSGVLVTNGETTLRSTFSLDGLLIHLGPGRLLLEDARIRGGLWLAPAGGEMGGSRLRLDAGSRIQWDASALEAALQQLPVDIIGWRILFPGE